MAKVKKNEDDNTIIFMIIGFCLGVIITLLLFEFYWIGVGGGTGMLIGVITSIISDYIKGKKKVSKKKK